MRRTTLLACAAALVFAGCAAGINHSKVSPPTYSLSPGGDLSKLGAITSLKANGATLYLGGQNGVAAMDGGGKLLWSLELPNAAVRLVDGDGESVAYTAYTLAGVDPHGFQSLLIGSLAEEPRFADVKVGLVSASGEAAWTVESAEQTALSPPALNRGTVGVTGAKSFTLYDRKTGKAVSSVPMFEDAYLNRGMAAMAATPRPAVLNGDYFAAHFNLLKKVDESGRELEVLKGSGMLTPYECITAGPLAFRDAVYFGNSPSALGKVGGETKLDTLLAEKVPRLFVVNGKGKSEWDRKLGDEKSGVGSLAANRDCVYVATNFTLAAFDGSGKEVWSARNGTGGLYPGTHRGLRYPKGSLLSKTFPVPKSPGNQMVATDTRVFVTSAFKKGDALTVLDAKTGEYLESIDMGTKVVDMVPFGSSLALATHDGLKFLVLK